MTEPNLPPTSAEERAAAYQNTIAVEREGVPSIISPAFLRRLIADVERLERERDALREEQKHHLLSPDAFAALEAHHD